MAVQTRRGNEADFQPNKMLPGEPAGVLDNKKVFYTFAPGDCRRLATHEEMTEMIDESVEGIKQDFTADLTQAITDSENATATAIVSAQNADDKALLADEAGDRANTAAENAEAVVLGDIATDTTVGVVRGNGDVSVGIDGAMSVNEASNANVTVVESAEDGEITTGLLGVILGLVKKKFALMLTSLSGKLDKSSMVQSAEISDATKPVSSVVTAWLWSQISSLANTVNGINNNLAAKSMFVVKTSTDTLATLPCPTNEIRRYYYLAGLPTDFPSSIITSATYVYVDIINISGIKIARITAVLGSGLIEHADGYLTGENYMWSAKY